MDAARREKREHGTTAFPFQIYPALDGSEARDSDFIPYHWHPELEIITIESGQVSVTIADRTFDGVQGDIFFAASEQLHEIRAAGRANQFHSFVFAADFLEFARADQVQTGLLEPLTDGRLRFETALLCGQSGQAEVRALLTQIMESCLVRAAGYQLFVKAALLSVIAVCEKHGLLRRQARQAPDYKSNQLKEIVRFLADNFASPLRLTEISARFGLSPQYFCAFFKDHFGKTLTQHINSLRIEQAARLLRDTDLPVMEVGFTVGFDNFSYFIKRFRAVYGVSPTHYRKGGQQD